MTLKIDTSTLADRLGVPEIQAGRVIKVRSKGADEIMEILREQGLKVLDHFTKLRPFSPENNLYYFSAEIDRLIICAKAPNPRVDMDSLPRKPEGYKDGYRWISYPD